MKRLLVLLAIVVSGCGGGGGGGSGSSSWTGPVTSKGFPAVAGNYRIDYSPVSGRCSDGSILTLDGSSQIVKVNQSESSISIISLTRIVSDISDTPATGNIDKDGEMELTRHRVVNANGTPLEVDYHYAAQAFENGVVGDVTAHITVPKGECDVSGTFSGNKLS
ncbi:MAG TPA: hypothetical protein VIW67_02505 [Terriglobales bacterium]|jgi:hypothetical protein